MSVSPQWKLFNIIFFVVVLLLISGEKNCFIALFYLQQWRTWCFSVQHSQMLNYWQWCSWSECRVCQFWCWLHCGQENMFEPVSTKDSRENSPEFSWHRMKSFKDHTYWVGVLCSEQSPEVWNGLNWLAAINSLARVPVRSVYPSRFMWSPEGCQFFPMTYQCLTLWT